MCCSSAVCAGTASCRNEVYDNSAVVNIMKRTLGVSSHIKSTEFEMLLRVLSRPSLRQSLCSSSSFVPSHVLFSSTSTVDPSGSSPPSSSSARHYNGDDYYDVLISGGGVVGATLAASLLEHTSGLKIGLIESRKPPTLEDIQKSPQPLLQVYALSPSSIELMKDIGVWDNIRPRSQPYTDMQVWEANGPGYLKFRADDMDIHELGRICENDTIVAALYEKISSTTSSSTCDVLIGTSVVNFTADPDPFGSKVATVHTKQGNNNTDADRKLTTRLLVGADGANSSIRKMSGISTWGWSYSHNAVVATVKTDSPPQLNNTAWQKYLSTGPLALLPLWDGYSSIVWSTSVPEANRLSKLSNEEFLVELQNQLTSNSTTDRWSVFSHEDAKLIGPLSKFLSNVKLEGAAILDTIMSSVRINDPPRSPPRVTGIESKRVVLPLMLQKASNYTSNRVALVGDAAHSIHPQAGQGLNLGLDDVKRLKDSIVKGISSGADYGDDKIFLESEYGKIQKVKNLCMMGGVDALDKVFSSKLKSISVLRSLGLLGINALGPLKNEIGKFAQGKQ